jgi:serine protease
MVVWGGEDGTDTFNTGGRYCAQAGPPITLSGAGRKVGGINTVRLTWGGATSTDIDVYRNGTLIETTPNDGSYIDSTGDTGRARYTYQVCEAGTSTCSDDATVTFRQ